MLFVPPTPGDSPHRYDMPRFPTKELSSRKCSLENVSKMLDYDRKHVLPKNRKPSSQAAWITVTVPTKAEGANQLPALKTKSSCARNIFNYLLRLNLSVISALVIALFAAILD